MTTTNYLQEMIEDRRNTPAFITEQALLNFTNAIVEAMEYCHWSRTDLARETGLHKAQITRILRSDHNMTARTMGKIAAALGKKLEIGMPSSELKTAEVPLDGQRSCAIE